jgi:ABC-2 type transport system permease protein
MNAAGIQARTQHHAPSAFGGSTSRFWSLTLMLARTDFKLRFFGSALGYLWTLARPLLLFGVLYLVFTAGFRIQTSGVSFYAEYLLIGIMLFTYFGEATGGSVTSLVSREGMLRKVRFPRMVVPLSVSLTALFNLAMNMIAVLIFITAAGVSPMWSWLEFPIFVLILVVLATGIGMLLSSLYVRYRDIAPIWDVLQQMLFYASPILYVAEKFEGRHVFGLDAPKLMVMNPIGAVMTQMRHAVLDSHAPTAAAAAGGAVYLLIPIGIVVGLFVLGMLVFLREAPRIAEHL